MKKTITFCILLLALFVASNVYAYTVDGYAYLQNQTDHGGIEVEFARTVPNSWTGTTYTNSNGYYIIDVDFGAYDITYSKDSYFDESVTDKLINSNTTLTDVTLWEHVTILNVPSIFSTIQEGIDRAWEGDTVLVEPGIYYENINFSRKNITVASLFLIDQDKSNISQTVIDGNHDGRVVQFRGPGGDNALLCGFTITDGSGSEGGGIRCQNCSPTITNVTITGNSASSYGCGIYCKYYSSPTIKNSIVSYNTGSYGIENDPNFPGNPSITYSDFYNTDGNFHGFGEWLGVNVMTNANGDSCDFYYNIQLDPLFVDQENGNYYLTENSPCIDAGDPSTTVPYNGGWIVDMGAYEFTGTHVTKSVDGIGEILFGGQVKSKVNVTTQGSLSEIDITVHPGETHTGAPNSVSRWYEITPTGSGATFDLTLSYQDNELNGEVEDNLNMWRWTGSSWDGPKYPSERNTSENWLKVTNQNSFSNWVISDAEDEGTLPVELSSLNAVYTVNESGNEFVTVKWVTASETDLHGFNIYRSESDNFNYVGNHINTSLILGASNTSQNQYYSFIDDIANPYKNYNYWLETVDFGGISEYYGPVKYIPGDIDGDQEVDLYSSTILYNNYPNPAIHTTTIKYQIKGSILEQDAIISIYNIKGELIRTVEGTKGKAEFDVSNFPNGIYFYQLKTSNYNEVKKMIVIR